jgi:class I fructose-bisphosphate aldolase
MDTATLLGNDASLLLDHKATAFPKELLTVPGPSFLDDVFTWSDRSPAVLRNLGTSTVTGALGGTGYLSILPVDQGIEHSAAASFAPNPEYFDPARLCDLAIGRETATRSRRPWATSASISRRYVHRIPFIVKINHNDLLRYPNTYDQQMFASVQQAVDLGAMGVGATIYFGSPDSVHQIEEVRKAFAEAHRQGLFTVLWCYLRNDAFVTGRS